jgi:hypothetical protein
MYSTFKIKPVLAYFSQSSSFLNIKGRLLQITNRASYQNFSLGWDAATCIDNYRFMFSVHHPLNVRRRESEWDAATCIDNYMFSVHHPLDVRRRGNEGGMLQLVRQLNVFRSPFP